MTEAYTIDDQIKSIEQEIAEYSQKLFQAQGMLMLAQHLKANCKIEWIKKDQDASSRPA